MSCYVMLCLLVAFYIKPGKISVRRLFQMIIFSSLFMPTKLIGPTHKTIHDMRFLLRRFFCWKGWVEKSKYRIPKFVGQKFRVVPWISITQVKHYRTTSQVLHVCWKEYQYSELYSIYNYPDIYTQGCPSQCRV